MRGYHLLVQAFETQVDGPLSLWRMASATPDLRLPSQPQSVAAIWPVPNYTAWWQRHMGVNNLPRVVKSQTHDTLRVFILEGCNADAIKCKVLLEP